MEKTKNSGARRLGYGYLLAAVIFLCNPCINIVDILPDFFGYCFLIAGLSKWADLCPNLSEALRGFSRLRWFMLLKMLCVLLIPLVDDTFVLLFTFSFGVIELLYLIPSVGQMFDGFEYVGTRFDGKALFVNLKNVRLLTFVFFIVRISAAVLPELCELSSFEYSGWVTAAPQTDIANYKSMFILIGLVFGILAMVLWLINIIPYISRVFKSRELIQRVIDEYKLQIESNEGIGYRRSTRLIFSLIIAGSVFIPNLWFDGFNVIPSFMCGVFFTLAMLKLCEANGAGKALIAVPALYTAVSAASFAVSVMFSLKYTLKDIEYEFEAYELYNTGAALTVAENVLLIAVAVLVGREVLRLVKRHLASNEEEKTAGYSKIHDIHLRERIRSLTALFICLIIVIAANAAYAVLRAQIPQGFYILPLLASLVWVFANAGVLNLIYSQIEYKYM